MIKKVKSREVCRIKRFREIEDIEWMEIVK